MELIKLSQALEDMKADKLLIKIIKNFSSYYEFEYYVLDSKVTKFDIKNIKNILQVNLTSKKYVYTEMDDIFILIDKIINGYYEEDVKNNLHGIDKIKFYLEKMFLEKIMQESDNN